MKLSYFGIRVTDLERSVAFYTGLLGLREVRRGDMSKYGGGRGSWVLLEDAESHQRLELNWYPPSSRYGGQYTPGDAIDHIAFMVDDVTASYNALVGSGVSATEITPAETGGHQACLLDPDGNWIDLYDQ